MRRREFIAFITLIGGAAATCPMAARAQQSAMPVIGLLLSGTAADGGLAHVLAGFRAGLGETGYVEGKNMLSNIAGRRGNPRCFRNWRPIWRAAGVTVIAAPGSVLAALAAKRATMTIPIVSAPARTRCKLVSWRASTDRAATSLASVFMNWELTGKAARALARVAAWSRTLRRAGGSSRSGCRELDHRPGGGQLRLLGTA